MTTFGDLNLGDTFEMNSARFIKTGKRTYRRPNEAFNYSTKSWVAVKFVAHW